MTHFEKGTLILAIFGTIVAIVTGVIFYEQLQVMSSTLDEMKRGGNDTHELAVQAKNQADKTKELAEHALEQAKATNKLSEETRRLAQEAHITNQNAMESDRPWIAQNNFQPETLLPDQVNTFSMGFVNTGKRPAYVNSIEIAVFHLKNFSNNPPFAQPKYMSKGILMPGIPIQVSHSFKVHGGWIDASGTNPEFGDIYAYARVGYTDVMTNKHHVTHVCYKYIREIAHFAACDSYNDSD